jgi:hypothetical protein
MWESVPEQIRRWMTRHRMLTLTVIFQHDGLLPCFVVVPLGHSSGALVDCGEDDVHWPISHSHSAPPPLPHHDPHYHTTPHHIARHHMTTGPRKCDNAG